MAGLRQTSSLSLTGLRARMAKLGSPGFRGIMAKNLAEEARTQVTNGFREERDPYGKKWAALRSREGKILQDTGRLRGSCATQSSAAGFRIEMAVVYAGPHQYGTKPHARKGGAIPQGRGGRFISKRRASKAKGRAQRVALFSAYQHPGLPQRQMIPMASTGGLGPIWTAAFNRIASDVISRYARGGL